MAIGFYVLRKFLYIISKWLVMVGIRIVADYGLHPCQVAQKLKRAKTLDITT